MMTAAGTVPCPQCGLEAVLPAVLGGCPVCLARTLLDTLSTPEAEPKEVAATLRLPGYWLNEPPLGRGGLGVVYQATFEVTGQEVAVKLLKPDRVHHLETVQRLHREGDVLEKLNHPNIIRLLGRGESAGQVYLVMELIRGKDLLRLIRDRQIKNATTALEMALAVAKALEYAHRQGVLHLDIKPANVLVNAAGEVKVADFGIARMLVAEKQDQRSFLRSDMAAGTRDYMAPEAERLPRSQLDARADIFGLGTLLYEMLTGEPPRACPTPASTIARLPRSVDRLIDRARALDRENRHRDATEFCRELDAIITSLPRPSWWR